MKNIIMIIVSVLISVNAYSQINLTSQVHSDLKCVSVNDNNFKYYNFNSKTNTVQLFNLDETLWKTVSLNIPADAFLDEIIDISTDKLNDNADIEIIYTTYSETYSDVFEDTESLIYEHRDLMIVNENGEQLFKAEGGSSFKLINDAVKGRVMLISVSNNESFSSFETVYAYSDYSF